MKKLALKKISLIIALLFIATVLTSLFVVTASAATGNTTEFAGGTGTADDPYLIETKYQLDNVRKNLSANYKLIGNIIFDSEDFTENGDFYNDGCGWQPIGQKNEPFNGIFDGNGYFVQNLHINAVTLDRGNTYAGLFGMVYGSIKRVGVINANINVQVLRNSQASSEWCTTYAGGIAGYIGLFSKIEECYFGGKIDLIKQSYNSSVALGGIVGSSSGNVENCYNFGMIRSYSDGSVGGIVGSNSNKISNCYNIGSVVGSP